MNTLIVTLALTVLAAGEAAADSSAPAAATRWTDDKIVQLASSMAPVGSEPAKPELLRQAVMNPVFPDEGRPDPFFEALSAYFDENHDGRFTAQEVDRTAEIYAARYTDLLRESLAKGPQQRLSAMFRVKTWKMLQKILLLKKTLAERGSPEWRYALVNPKAPNEAWDRENTLSNAADFQRRVCDASAKTPVIVKFGSTQCADCTLMEYTQGIRTAAEKYAGRYSLLKFWWGPNLPDDNDRLRKAEGAKGSPTFVVYKKGRRYPCGFAFLDVEGAGLEACLATALKEDAADTGACGAPLL